MLSMPAAAMLAVDHALIGPNVTTCVPTSVDPEYASSVNVSPVEEPALEGENGLVEVGMMKITVAVGDGVSVSVAVS